MNGSDTAVCFVLSIASISLGFVERDATTKACFVRGNSARRPRITCAGLTVPEIVEMKFAFVLAASLISTAALAQSSTTIIEKRDNPSTTVIEKNDATVVQKRPVETTGSVGCSTTTKQKTDEFGDTTTKQKTEC